MIRKSKRRLALPRVVAVDVDGTLIVDGQPNGVLIQYLLKCKQHGFEVIVWSMRGKGAAHNAVAACGLQSTVDVICGKPGYVIDDEGWKWIAKTRWVRDLKCLFS